MSFDDEQARALGRAVEEHNARQPHAPLKVGNFAPAPDGLGGVLQLLVLKPCRCGQPRGSALFRGATLGFAAHAAKDFVEALTPPDDD